MPKTAPSFPLAFVSEKEVLRIDNGNENMMMIMMILILMITLEFSESWSYPEVWWIESESNVNDVSALDSLWLSPHNQKLSAWEFQNEYEMTEAYEGEAIVPSACILKTISKKAKEKLYAKFFAWFSSHNPKLSSAEIQLDTRWLKHQMWARGNDSS